MVIIDVFACCMSFTNCYYFELKQITTITLNRYNNKKNKSQIRLLFFEDIFESIIQLQLVALLLHELRQHQPIQPKPKEHYRLDGNHISKHEYSHHCE